MVTERTFSCTTLASFRIGAMASEASEHSSPITMCGLNWSSMRFTALVACSGLHAESSYCTSSLTPFTAPFSSPSASSMPSLSITPKYDPGPEIGIATPMRTARSCAATTVDARTMAPASASLLARFMTPPPVGCGRMYYRKLAKRNALAFAASRMSYLVGIDIGGTFTDCAIVDRAGKLLTTKVPSTPPDFARGMMDALGAGAQALGISLDDFCRDIAFLSHGTTVGTNTIIQKRGAKVGLITTKGHEDAIHIMRGSRGYGGRDIRKVVHFPETSKPAPIVPKRLIRGISERVDCFGEVVVKLNEKEAALAIQELLK